MKGKEGRYLPDKEIAYRYTAAMLFGQEAELNMKAILHTIDYCFADLEDTLQQKELERFKTFDQFLSKATSGSLQAKMRSAGIAWPKKVWKLMDCAITTRNELAHEFLVRLQLPPPNDEQREAILSELNERVILLYQAMMITRNSRKNIEKMSIDQHDRLNSMMRGFGIEPSEINKGLWHNKEENEEG